MKYRRPYDRQLRLFKRIHSHLKSVNSRNDQVCRERETQRGAEAEKEYRRSRRLIADIEKELKR